MAPQVKTWAKYCLAILALLLIAVLIFGYTTNPIILCTIAYLFGSVPFGYVLTKLFTKQDIRSIGSGNIGATNVLRTGNKSLAALTLILDALKAILAVLWLSTYTTIDLIPYAIAISVMVGHLFPVWLDFKGGKGVAPGLGVLFALSWPMALIALVLWLAFAFMFKYSSLAALLAVSIIPIFSWAFVSYQLAIFTTILGLLIIARHKQNIYRLLQGTEPKIGQH